MPDMEYARIELNKLNEIKRTGEIILEEYKFIIPWLCFRRNGEIW